MCAIGNLVASALERREGGRGVAVFFEERRVRVFTSLHARVHLGEDATVGSMVCLAHTSVREREARNNRLRALRERDRHLGERRARSLQRVLPRILVYV